MSNIRNEQQEKIKVHCSGGGDLYIQTRDLFALPKIQDIIKRAAKLIFSPLAANESLKLKALNVAYSGKESDFDAIQHIFTSTLHPSTIRIIEDANEKIIYYDYINCQAQLVFDHAGKFLAFGITHYTGTSS